MIDAETYKNEIVPKQKEVCLTMGQAHVPVDLETYVPAFYGSKIGIALSTLTQEPLNGLRHEPENGTNGWYIWGGEELLSDPDFFQPLHVDHLTKYVSEQTLHFLGLAPGFRFLISGESADVWFDETILNTDEDATP